MNKIRTITAMTTKYSDYVEYRFLRQDISRYYRAERMSEASQNRINQMMHKHGKPFIQASGIWVDWFVRD